MLPGSTLLKGTLLAGLSFFGKFAYASFTEGDAQRLRAEYSRVYHTVNALKAGTIIPRASYGTLPAVIRDFDDIFANYDDQNFDRTVVCEKTRGGDAVYKLLSFDSATGYYMQLFSKAGDVVGYCHTELGKACQIKPGAFYEE